MNSLSWTLYAAGVLDSIKILLVILAIALGPVFLIATAMQRDTCMSGDELWPWPKGAVFAAILCAFMTCVLPSARTVYLIAASEAGSKIAESPEGREMLDLIRRRIREALSDKA